MSLDSLSPEDQDNIAKLLPDTKYSSYVALQKLICAQWSQQIVHNRMDDKEADVKRGGIMVLTALRKAVEDRFRTQELERAEEIAFKEAMKGLGY